MGERLARLRRWDRELAGSRAALLAVVAVACGLGILFALLWPREPITNPDTPSYLAWGAKRTAGYPLALRLTTAVFGDVRAVLYLQLIAFLAGLSLAAVELQRLTRSLLVGPALLLATLGRLEIYDLVFRVLTEGFFLALVSAATGLALRYSRLRRGPQLAWLSASIGAAILFRPVGYAFLPLPVILALARAPLAFRWRLALAVGPVAAMLLAGSLAYKLEHGSFRTQSFAGHNLLGKTAFLTHGTETEHPEVAARMRESMAGARQHELDLDGWPARFMYRIPFYDHLRYRVVDPMLAGRPDAETIRASVAVDLVAAQPWQYLGDVALNLYALWALPHVTTSDELDDIRAEVARAWGRAGMPNTHHFGGARPALMVRSLQLGLLVVLSISLVAGAFGLVQLLRRRPLQARLLALCYCSLQVHGYFLLVALLQAGLNRYAAIMWPTQIAIGLIALSWLVDRRRPEPA